MATRTKKLKHFPIRKPTLSIEGLYNKPLSALIRIAVKDLETNVKNGAKVDMADWGRRNGECTGCFAGHCIMPYAKGIESFINRNRYARDIALALNCVRSGHLYSAVEYLYSDITDDDYKRIYNIKRKSWVQSWGTYDYIGNEERFSKSMLKIADALEKIGL